ncbi:hypothetical protein DIURU_003236 [Diutina rugosa]|uniref:Ribosomal RNA-processing protein 43 n=1 Tax=Diutina rugosa TaxID=5481 RepID=A0A642UM45_DIURU|nr:uncharacterized protein DIURU_003236 [Diutina rugosa]KAA8901527.1 hypothetical protein DIURU_003236 [Diutina rugosa]
MSSLPQIEFTPEVLARIAPDVFLQRHLDLGYRPNLRKFDEFAPLAVTTGDLTDLAHRVVGSSSVKSGSTTVITTISVSLCEVDGTETGEFAPVYPVVEVLRGRSGAPTDEEMVLSQALYEHLYHAHVVSRSSLLVEHLGLAVNDAADPEKPPQIYYPDLNPDEYQLLSQHPKRYTYVLHAYVKVFSKQTTTSSVYDLCYLSILRALQSTKLPRVYVSEAASVTRVVRHRMTTKRGVVSSAAGVLNLDTNQELLVPLPVQDGGVSANFGVVIHKEEPVLLCDLCGEAEEASVTSRISVTSNPEGRLKRVSIIAGDCAIPLPKLKQAIELATTRAKVVSQL